MKIVCALSLFLSTLSSSFADDRDGLRGSLASKSKLTEEETAGRQLQTCTCRLECTTNAQQGVPCEFFNNVCEFPDGSPCSPTAGQQPPPAISCDDVSGANLKQSQANFADLPIVITALTETPPFSFCYFASSGFDFTGVQSQMIQRIVNGVVLEEVAMPVPADNAQACVTDASPSLVASIVNCPADQVYTLNRENSSEQIQMEFLDPDSTTPLPTQEQTEETTTVATTTAIECVDTMGYLEAQVPTTGGPNTSIQVTLIKNSPSSLTLLMDHQQGATPTAWRIRDTVTSELVAAGDYSFYVRADYNVFDVDLFDCGARFEISIAMPSNAVFTAQIGYPF